MKCRLKYAKGFSRQINGKEILAREITGSSSQRWKTQNFDYRLVWLLSSVLGEGDEAEAGQVGRDKILF